MAHSPHSTPTSREVVAALYCYGRRRVAWRVRRAQLAVRRILGLVRLARAILAPIEAVGRAVRRVLAVLLAPWTFAGYFALIQDRVAPYGYDGGAAVLGAVEWVRGALAAAWALLGACWPF